MNSLKLIVIICVGLMLPLSLAAQSSDKENVAVDTSLLSLIQNIQLLDRSDPKIYKIAFIDSLQKQLEEELKSSILGLVKPIDSSATDKGLSVWVYLSENIDDYMLFDVRIYDLYLPIVSSLITDSTRLIDLTNYFKLNLVMSVTSMGQIPEPFEMANSALSISSELKSIYGSVEKLEDASGQLKQFFEMDSVKPVDAWSEFNRLILDTHAALTFGTIMEDIDRIRRFKSLLIRQ